MNYDVLPDISWCPVHCGVMNEDDKHCDQSQYDEEYDEDGEPRECKPEQLYIRVKRCVGCFQNVEKDGHARGCPTGQNGPPNYE